MSRLAKQPIAILPTVDVSIAGGEVKVKGPLGELSRRFKSTVGIRLENNAIRVEMKNQSKESKMLSGTYVSHLKNMMQGVTTLYQKKLIVEGIGFKAEVKGQEIVFGLGFSHLVRVVVPKTLKVIVEKGVISVSGIDKEEVGRFAAAIRDLKKPEPYKGKGIRYEDEVIRRKQGKKTV